MKTAYVLFNNDMPVLVFGDLSDAVAEASARQKEAERLAALGGSYPISYWHVHDVPVKG